MTNLKLTDTQLVLLSAAAQRDDLLITVPDTLKASAVKTAVGKLLSQGLLEEVGVRSSEPAFRRDDRDQPVGLKLTRAGLAAIGLDADTEHAVSEEPMEVNSAHASLEAAAVRSPRDGSKRALVIELLRREQGASLDDLVQATGWLPHTTRAALTGLRQRGYMLTRTQGESGASVYRLIAEPDLAPAGEPAAVEA